MFIGDKLLRTSIGRYRSINWFGQNHGVNSRIVVGSITTNLSEHAIVFRTYSYSSVGASDMVMQFLINGATVIEGGVQFGTYPQLPTVETIPGNFVDMLTGIYIPPNSEFEVRLDNLTGGAITVSNGNVMVGMFYDKDIEQSEPKYACPSWYTNPPAWLEQALRNKRD